MDTHVHDRRRILVRAQHVSLVAPRADTTGLRSDDPVRPTVRPESLLLFEADGPRVQDD